MDNTIGNQQAKTTDLAWLAGIIDGEGSILLGSKGHSGAYKGINVGATIHITNTDCNIIDKCQEIVNSLGLSNYIFVKKPASSTHRLVFRLDITKMSAIKTLLEAIMPYLVGKLGQAKMVYRFVVTRIAKQKAPYDEEDLSNIDAYYTTYHGMRNRKQALMSKPQRLNVEHTVVSSVEDKV